MNDKTKNIIKIVVIIIIILAAFGYYFYKKGKKTVTLQSLPGELPGNPTSGNMTGASNDEIKNISDLLYADMKGFNAFGHNYEPYNQAVLLSDTDLIKLYNTFNASYQVDSGQTLTQWIENETYSDGTQPANIIARLKKLNSL